MDLTNVFKATVKALKSRRKNSLNNNNDVDLKSPSSKKKDDDFDLKAKNVTIAKRGKAIGQEKFEMTQSISKLKEFLLLHRKEYLSAGSHLHNGSKMEDSERDQIDQDSEKIIRTCQETIKHFKQEASAQKVLPQVRQHRDGVFLLIEAYLKSVCKMYSEQRAVRVKRVVDRKRISRLEPELRFRGNLKKSPSEDLPNEKNSTTTTVVEGDRVCEASQTTTSAPSTTTDSSTNNKSSNSQDWQTTTWSDDDELSSEEAQMFEEENQALVEEMNSLMSEVKEIEGKVVEVSRLQEIFAEKVWDQDKEIDQINDVVAGTSENIISGNEEIREAMKNNAGFRVWILFFLVVCTFALLFLDWYND